MSQTEPIPAPPVADPEAAARAAGLRYVNDQMPGIRRERVGDTFRYRDPQGRLISDKRTLERIRKLAIPPAYTDVWICPLPNGHLQATGRDARGRKQYRYHPRWREVRDETKYHRMMAFGQALPALRERVDRDLRRPGLPREKVLATVVRLLETTLIRVGNHEYAKSNRSYGLTTMRDRHVTIENATVRFEFKGKSGKKHQVSIADRRLANIVKKSRDLPGYELFQYIDEQGQRHDVTSDDVNAYLREITGQDFTAKDFRTWAGTVLAAIALQEAEPWEKEAQARKNIVQAIERVAERLGNTPSICRKCYVHPEIIAAYLEGMLIEPLEQRIAQELRDNPYALQPEEQAVLHLLQRRLARARGDTERAEHR
ncbi:DNA topoisomerase IB [Kallotenue papyrolyticum]|uniref:DNA topoisomerase IB n=1 Tax=Kallotenue papyrolyticum TaxID=1325125 RepID=UPI0006941B20